jgi:hypothetical protein
MKRAFGFILALGILGLLVVAGVSSGASQSRIQRGFNLAPVPLDLTGKNRELVGLGSYLVNGAGGCNDCHTNPPFAEGGDPQLGQPTIINTAGYLAGGMAFGPFISRNITRMKTDCRLV